MEKKLEERTTLQHSRLVSGADDRSFFLLLARIVSLEGKLVPGEGRGRSG